jgi:arylsulfatase A-like enzyme
MTTATHLPRAGASRPWTVAVAVVATAGLAAGLLALPRLGVWWKERALPRGQKPTVLLITLDATRADRLGAYGYGQGRTPAADELAAQGVLFEQAYVAAPLCLPSHAAILTGRLPPHNGTRDELDVLGPDAPTLAERFRAAGYRTAAFVGTTSLDHSRGLDRGFDVYDDDFGPPGKRVGAYERGAASEVVDQALAWVQAPGGDEPVFLWAHLADSMAPHNLPPAVAKDFPGRAYDGEIAFVDESMGRLIAGVRSRHPQALVVALADHGESLGDHGEDTFGYFLYSPTTRVPLLISMPGRIPSGVRVGPVVRTVDLAPTLLDLVGLPSLSGADGVSLVPLMVGRSTDGPGPAVMENVSLRSKYGLAPLFALRSGPYLYVKAPRPELYDSAQDAQEKDDASARLPRVAARLALDLASRVPESVSPERGGLRDPKDALDLYNRYQLALEMEGRRDFVHAIEAQRSIISEVPDFLYSRRKLTELLIREGRVGESELEMKGLVEKKQALDSTYLNLALIRYRLKQPEEALAWLEKGEAEFPRSPAVRHRRGRLLLEAKKYGEAEGELREALSLEPRLLDAYVALGQALHGQGRDEEANGVLQELRRLAPDSPEAAEAAETTAGLELTPVSPAPAVSPGAAAPPTASPSPR